jgi:hypothetical protein
MLVMQMQMRQEIMILRMWKMQQGVFENKACDDINQGRFMM